MIELKDYTLEIYTVDRRCKTGRKLLSKYEYFQVQDLWMQEEVRDLQFRLYPKQKYILELHETWVLKTNLLTGNTFFERYDTPYYLSPSSETYWST